MTAVTGSDGGIASVRHGLAALKSGGARKIYGRRESL
jgi:hypothetical protein